MDHETPALPPAPRFRCRGAGEIRQMLEAKSARRQARGEALDVDAELAALTSAPSPADAGPREEVRQLVVARNERRARQGKEPLTWRPRSSASCAISAHDFGVKTGIGWARRWPKTAASSSTTSCSGRAAT